MDNYGFPSTVLPDGSIEIPPAFRALMGLPKDGHCLIRVEGEEIILTPVVVDRPDPTPECPGAPKIDR